MRWQRAPSTSTPRTTRSSPPPHLLDRALLLSIGHGGKRLFELGDDLARLGSARSTQSHLESWLLDVGHGATVVRERVETRQEREKNKRKIHKDVGMAITGMTQAETRDRGWLARGTPHGRRSRGARTCHHRSPANPGLEEFSLTRVFTRLAGMLLLLLLLLLLATPALLVLAPALHPSPAPPPRSSARG